MATDGTPHLLLLPDKNEAFASDAAPPVTAPPTDPAAPVASKKPSICQWHSSESMSDSYSSSDSSGVIIDECDGSMPNSHAVASPALTEEQHATKWITKSTSTMGAHVPQYLPAKASSNASSNGAPKLCVSIPTNTRNNEKTGKIEKNEMIDSDISDISIWENCLKFSKSETEKRRLSIIGTCAPLSESSKSESSGWKRCRKRASKGPSKNGQRKSKPRSNFNMQRMLWSLFEYVPFLFLGGNTTVCNM
eukprot:Filipodium_phascolosomae@DN4405_c0_g1_i1.p1